MLPQFLEDYLLSLVCFETGLSLLHPGIGRDSELSVPATTLGRQAAAQISSCT